MLFCWELPGGLRDQFRILIETWCMKLFRESDYLFSSPNYRSSFQKPYSRTYYMNIFNAFTFTTKRLIYQKYYMVNLALNIKFECKTKEP